MHCAYKVEHITTLINHIISNTDGYFNKNNLSKKKCNWCHDTVDNLFSYSRSTSSCQFCIKEFVQYVTKKDMHFEEWNICLNCYFCVISWNDIRGSILNLMVNIIFTFHILAQP